jgi:hypothetical protein
VIATEVRQFIVGALKQANVLGLRPQDRDAFLAGKGDVDFSQLEMDSLARMELCICIEVGTGVEITPDQLDDIKSLAGLAKILENDK